MNISDIYGPVLTGKENLSHKEIQVKCPFHDDKNPSMSINTETGMFHCFACGASGSSIGFIMKYYNLSYADALKQTGMENTPISVLPQKKKKQPEKKETIDYFEYINNMLNNSTFHNENFPFYCKKLYELRGITFNTAITCCIGYDINKGWIFPIFRYPDLKIAGYEVRKKDFTLFDNGNKCFKAENTPSCLSVVYQGWNKKKAYICEGFIDSSFLYQYLYERECRIRKHSNFQINEWIFSPSNGVHSLPSLMEELQLWDDFEEIIFCLDNDKAGNDTKAILAEMPHKGRFKFFNQFKENQDFEGWYKNYDNEIKKLSTKHY